MVDTREHLADRTEITSGKDGIISVTVEDKDAQRAAEMANFYIDQLQALMGTLTITEAAHRRKFFEEQVKQEMDRLAEAEVQLKNTQETTGMIQLSDQARAIIQSIAQLRAAIATKEIQLAGLRSFGTEENPSVRLAEQELAALRAQLGKAEKSQTGGSGDIYVATANLPKAGLEYLRKYREVKYHEFVFTELSKQYEMARVEEAKSAPLIQILDRAEPADKKSWPPRSLLLTGLIVLWLLVGCAIVFTYEKLSKLSHDARYRGEVDSIFASPWLERSLHRTHRILQGRA
jgi:capsule polysaccharide export protein KpsE/RkpR